MRTQNRPFRLTAAVAVSGLLLAQGLPQPALAQPAPPPQAGAPDQQTGDPPARVGRLALVTGTVSFHTQDESQWNPASPNYPIVEGNAFWTQPSAQATIQVSASTIAMAPETELDITTLNGTAFQGTLPQGEVYAHVQAASPNETYAVQTPRGLVTLSSPGRYSVAAGDTQARPWSQWWRAPLTSPVRAWISMSAPIRRQPSPEPTPSKGRSARRNAIRSSPPCWPASSRGRQGRSQLLHRRRWRRCRAVTNWRNTARGRTKPIRPGVVPAGSVQLGAVSGRPLGLRCPLGLDLGGQRSVGLRTIPLRPLGAGRRALGLGARCRGGGLRRSAGLCAGAGNVLRRWRRGRRRGGHRRSAGRRQYRLVSAGTARGIPSLVSREPDLCAERQHHACHQRDQHHDHQPQCDDQ